MTQSPADASVRYARSAGVHIAYQVVGDGPLDVVYVPGFLSQLEWNWELPGQARFLRRLASFGRLVTFDKRGTGLSDGVTGVPTLEERMDDLRAVMDAASSERAALVGVAEGGPLCLMFAATYPDRTSALVLYASLAKFTQGPGYPWGWTPASISLYLSATEDWGTGTGAELLAPSLAGDAEYRRWFARLQRLAASPGSALKLLEMNADIDARQVLPAVRVPTLVLNRRQDAFVDPGHSGYLAGHIEGARRVELDGADHWPWAGDAEALLEEIEELVTGARGERDVDRVLATVLFTDMVKSTERAAEQGDAGWRKLLERHHAIVRREIARHRGREIKNLGDGFLASFDGPARAIRCACAIVEGLEEAGVPVRAGVHTGECEVLGEDLGGIAVHIGARVMSSAGAGEVLVSSTVRDLVAGSGIAFEDRGEYVLKGVPGAWRLYAVSGAP